MENKSENQKNRSARSSSEIEPSSKEVLMLGGGLLMLMFGVVGALMFSEDQELHATAVEAADSQQVSKAFQADPTPLPSHDIASTKNPAIVPVSFNYEAPTTEESSPLEQKHVYFEFDQATLSDEAKTLLHEQVQNMSEQDSWTITVKGHTDQRGSESYNQSLGLRRAQSVQAFLVSEGISESSIQVESLGAQSTICSENTEDCFGQNRRADITLTQDHPVTTAHVPLEQENSPIESEDIEVEEITSSDVSIDEPISEDEEPATTAMLTETTQDDNSDEDTTSTVSLP